MVKLCIDGFKLGIWQNEQRARSGGRGRPLTSEEKEMLESIPNWKWRVSLEHNLQMGIKLSKKYGMVPRQFVTECGFPLGTWQHNKRKCKDRHQRKLLEEIPGWFWKRSRTDGAKSMWNRRHGKGNIKN